jgi:ribosomal protein L11 methyltransferase
MPWLQVRLAISPEQAETYEDAFLEVGAVSVTFMDAEDQPIFEPELNTTPLWSHTHLLALFEAAPSRPVLAHLELLTGSPLPEHHSEVIEDQDWERSWMDNFQPMRFGQRLWIVPSWHAAPSLTRSTCCWTRAWRSAPAPTPPPRCAWNGSTART